MTLDSSPVTATISALPSCTYYNGPGNDGYGATLTATANGALGAIDGHTVAANERILVRSQSSAVQNGVYDVTAVGDASHPWILSRPGVYSTGGDLSQRMPFCVLGGNTYADTVWCLQDIVTTTGTDAVNYARQAATGLKNSYTSSDQTITAAGSLTLAHSLGVAPTLVAASLVCQTAEGNYSVGDVTPISVTICNTSNTTHRGLSIVVDATNLNVRYGSDSQSFLLLNKTTGVTFAITNSKWKARFSAWA